MKNKIISHNAGYLLVENMYFSYIRICLYSAKLYFLKIWYAQIFFREKIVQCILCGRYTLRHTRNTKAHRVTTCCLGKTRKFRTMLNFFLSRLSISNTFAVVFILQHCISLKCGICTYSSERKLYSAFSVEDTCLDIHATPKHIELQRVV